MLSHSLLAINESNKRYFAVGDFNVNPLNVNKRSIQYYLDTLKSIGCISLVNKPTRVTNHSSTRLDYLYTNAIKGEIDVGVLQVNLTDQFPLVAKIKDSTSVKIEHNRVKIRKSSIVDGEQYVR